MTFQEALAKIKEAQGMGYTYQLGDVTLAIAEQAEASRVLILALQDAFIKLQGELGDTASFRVKP